MKKLLTLLLCCAFTLSIIACGTNEDTDNSALSNSLIQSEVPNDDSGNSGNSEVVDIGKSSKDYNIVYIAPQASNPYFLTLDAGCQDMAEELGVTVTYMAPATNDMQGQTTVVQAAMASNPDFVIIAPVDSEGMMAVCQEFLDDGIQMITVDRDFNDPSMRLAFIASDSYLGGVYAADTINELLDGEGHVAYLGFTPGISSIDDRYAGWNDALEKYPGLELTSEQFESSDIQKLTAKANAMITADPDLKAIFAGFTNATIAAATAVKENGLSDDIYVVGFDASPDEVALLSDGSADALICQLVYEMGQLAVQYAVDYLENGTLPPEETHTEFVTITADNMSDPEISRYVYRSAN